MQRPILMVNKTAREFGRTHRPRVRAILAELSDKIKTHPRWASRKTVRHFLDEQQEKYELK